MREQKYRGKRKDTEEWIYGDKSYEPCGNKYYILVPNEDGILFDYDHIGAIEVSPETVGEYTGSTDANDIEACENDIIECTDNCNVKGIIKYGGYRGPCESKDTLHIGFYVDWIDDFARSTLRNDLGFWLKISKIIGNTTDNPELLKKKEG